MNFKLSQFILAALIVLVTGQIALADGANSARKYSCQYMSTAKNFEMTVEGQVALIRDEGSSAYSYGAIRPGAGQKDQDALVAKGLGYYLLSNLDQDRSASSQSLALNSCGNSQAIIFTGYHTMCAVCVAQ